jgi:hypothetical protein
VHSLHSPILGSGLIGRSQVQHRLSNSGDTAQPELCIDGCDQIRVDWISLPLRELASVCAHSSACTAGTRHPCRLDIWLAVRKPSTCGIALRRLPFTNRTVGVLRYFRNDIEIPELPGFDWA